MLPLWTLSLAFIAAAAPESPPPPQLAERLLAAFEPGDRQRLLETYREALANPADSELNGRLAMLLHGFGQYELASTFYRRVGSIEPSNFRWPYYLGVAMTAIGREAEAIPALRRAIELAPDYLPAQLRLGKLLRTVGDWDESGRVYRQVVRQHPDSARAHYGLGRVRFAQGETRAALKSYRTASRLAPDFGAAHYGLGTAYRSLGEEEKARRHLLLFQRVQENPPPLADPLLDSLRRLQSKAEYHYLRGLGFQRKARISEALGEFERALKEDPRHAGAHANLFFSFLTLGNLVKAEEHYQAAHELDPRLHEIHHNLGILRTLQKRDREAEAAFREALELDPYRAESHYLLGANLANGGQVREAEERFRLAIENRSQFMDAHFQLGLLLQKQGRDAEAVGHFLKTLAIEDEGTPVRHYVLAHSYARLGKIDKAVDAAVKAREKALSAGKRELAADVGKFLQRLRQAGKRP